MRLLPALRQLAVADPRAARDQLVKLADLPDAEVKAGEPGADAADGGRVLGRLGEHGAGARVAEYPLDLLL